MTDAWAFSGVRRLRISAETDFEPPPRLVPLADTGAALERALAAPLASPPLRALAGELSDDDRVAVVVPDASRACPVAPLLAALVGELEAAGVADTRIEVFVACGLHRTTTPDERAALVGPGLIGRLAVHDAQGQLPGIVRLDDPSEVTAGVPAPPVWMNAAVAGAGLVVALGVVEPHLYAGFSGGPKTVAIGCAGEPTIAWTHDPRFLDQPGVRLGEIDGNPFQDALRAIVARTRLRFAVNVVLAEGGGVAGLAAGDPAAAQRALIAAHGDAWLRSRPGAYDLVVAGVPAPKHRGLYHASRAATYLALVDRPVIADGGLIAICSDLPDGAGDGPGEANFGALMAAAESPADLLRRGRREPLGPGGQRAYMVARVLDRFRVGVIGAGDGDALRSMGLLPLRSIDEAFRTAARARGVPPRALVVADGFDTIVTRSG